MGANACRIAVDIGSAKDSLKLAGSELLTISLPHGFSQDEEKP